jgi:hypothetical protein
VGQSKGKNKGRSEKKKKKKTKTPNLLKERDETLRASLDRDKRRNQVKIIATSLPDAPNFIT